MTHIVSEAAKTFGKSHCIHDISIFSLMLHGYAVDLAEIYIRRWSLQENIIRDFLLPLGLDTNHGYNKRPVGNSEVAKKWAALEKRLANGVVLGGRST